MWKFSSNLTRGCRYVLTDDGRLHVVNLKTGSIETSIVAHEQVGMANMMVDAVVLVLDNDGDDVDGVAYFHWKLCAAFYYFIIVNTIILFAPGTAGLRHASSQEHIGNLGGGRGHQAVAPLSSHATRHVSRRSPRKYFSKLSREFVTI